MKGIHNPATPPETSRILVVDDNAPARYAVSRTLRKAGFEVLEAGTGQDALAIAERELPDLVVLDVNLPDIHGFEIARRLKSDERTGTTPILQLSASAIRSEDRIDGLAAGADAYLVEPVEPGELIANIRALLRLRTAEARLQRTAAMLSTVIDSSPLSIAVFEADGSVVRWNRAAERLFGIRADEIEGRELASASLPDWLVNARHVAEWLQSGSSVEHTFQRADGVAIDIAMFAAPLQGATGYVAIFEDVSIRKRFERERTEWLARERDARTEAEAANRLKDEFLATLSHELRTPLNAILGWLQILRREAIDQEKRERALEIIERNAIAQQQIINDILEVSQIVRGQLRLEMQPLDVVAAVEAAVESVRPTTLAKRQAVTLRIPENRPLVSADHARVQQMLWNLLANATKYTQREGRIDVDVSVGETDVDITIRDNGIGIAAHALPHVFERFRQGHAGPTREYGGLGLGLAIVRHLADMHGGAVQAISEGTGHGAAFILSLPLMLDQPVLSTAEQRA
jgi:PAS domain S-box-containing protein